MTYCQGEWDCHGPTGMEGAAGGLYAQKMRVYVCACVLFFFSLLEIEKKWLVISSAGQKDVEMMKVAVGENQ